MHTEQIALTMSKMPSGTAIADWRHRTRQSATRGLNRTDTCQFLRCCAIINSLPRLGAAARQCLSACKATQLRGSASLTPVFLGKRSDTRGMIVKIMQTRHRSVHSAPLMPRPSILLGCDCWLENGLRALRHGARLCRREVHKQDLSETR